MWGRSGATEGEAPADYYRERGSSGGESWGQTGASGGVKKIRVTPDPVLVSDGAVFSKEKSLEFIF